MEWRLSQQLVSQFKIFDYIFESEIVIVEKHQKNSPKQHIKLIKEKLILFVCNEKNDFLRIYEGDHNITSTCMTKEKENN